jgi:hypothetical protein
MVLARPPIEERPFDHNPGQPSYEFNRSGCLQNPVTSLRMPERDFSPISV